MHFDCIAQKHTQSRHTFHLIQSILCVYIFFPAYSQKLFRYCLLKSVLSVIVFPRISNSFTIFSILALTIRCRTKPIGYTCLFVHVSFAPIGTCHTARHIVHTYYTFFLSLFSALSCSWYRYRYHFHHHFPGKHSIAIR